MKKKILPVSRGVSEITSLEEYRPGLFVEVVTLKFLDAKSLKPVIEGLSSEYGRISPDAKSNSLISICCGKQKPTMSPLRKQGSRAKKLDSRFRGNDKYCFRNRN